MFSWFDLAWPWIGLGLAGVLVVLLFATNVLRSASASSRWRDARWLSFLSVPVYMVHNVEEYGIDANGVAHAFPDSLCTLLGQPPYPGCGIPTEFYLFVNLPLIWIAAPLAAILGGGRLVALTLWGVIAINSMVHIVPAIAMREYDPGLVTAIVLFLPLSVWTLVTVTGRSGPFRRAAIVVLLAAGVVMHAVLMSSALLFLRGIIPPWLLLALQPTAIAIGYGIVWSAQGRLGRAGRESPL